MKSPDGFITGQAQGERAPKPYCLFDRMSVGMADVKTAPKQVLRNVAEPQAHPLLVDHVKKGWGHLDKIPPQEDKLSLARSVMLVCEPSLKNQQNSHGVHLTLGARGHLPSGYIVSLL